MKTYKIQFELNVTKEWSRPGGITIQILKDRILNYFTSSLVNGAFYNEFNVKNIEVKLKK